MTRPGAGVGGTLGTLAWKSVLVPSCPGLCDTYLCTHLPASHENLRLQNLRSEGWAQAVAASQKHCQGVLAS